MKFLHDAEACLIAARSEGIEVGIEEGREQGLLVGKVQALQQILGHGETALQELLQRDCDGLSAFVAKLQQDLLSRGI